MTSIIEYFTNDRLIKLHKCIDQIKLHEKLMLASSKSSLTGKKPFRNCRFLKAEMETRGQRSGSFSKKFASGRR